MSIFCAWNVFEEKEKNDKDNMCGGEKEKKNVWLRKKI